MKQAEGCLKTFWHKIVTLHHPSWIKVNILLGFQTLDDSITGQLFDHTTSFDLEIERD